MNESILLLDASNNMISKLKNHLPNYKFYHDKTIEQALRDAIVKHVSLIIIMKDHFMETGGYLCQQFRMHNIQTPIVVVSSSTDEYDMVVAYELGADDYVMLPINERVLLARIKAQVRRSYLCNMKRFEMDSERILTVGKLRIFPESYRVEVQNRKSDLSGREMKLLLFFYENKGRVLTRSELLEICDSSDERIIDTYVSKLRRKIEPKRSKPTYIETVKHVGYRFRTPVIGSTEEQ
ncbi:response regulator transcription factor [Halalkalibacter hemicellulosilyticus]|uniref:Two-component response regulator SA14-24 n=1 Tax=Halalkalibacter hemicellulosilyticusJCM 9152 TaxID=1236971 RepID=W4QJD4_9BACI|nr:response regulator transcription factor [Halalkalibacter hemicellulosilyticus]GAE31424.1 two-component response regulator SA14-24 [Halalkalibacter hemicellulosilyticusJCM 9152]